MKNILIFDYDGVIVDSLSIFRENFIRACKINGFDQISKQAFLDLFNGNMYESMIKSGISKEKIPNILKSLKSRLLDAQNNLYLFDGVDSMLKKLSKENKIIIITSNITEVVEKFLESKNINCYRNIVGGEKETSKIIKIKAIKTEFPNYQYFYIGDTRGDIIEGKNAGVKTIAVTWGWHSKTSLKKECPDYIIDFPIELVKLFKNLKSNKIL